jgi:5-methylcytosine-specific restriction endonuclease McrA
MLDSVHSGRRVIQTGTCHQDHYLSLAHGGTHDISNIVLACTHCNTRKRDLHGDDYKEECLREASPAVRKHLTRIHRVRLQHAF